MRMLEEIGRPSHEPVLVLLDFDNVDVATGSFLREAVLEFRNMVRRRFPSLYPVVANANTEIVEDLELVLEKRGEVLLVCEINSQGELVEPRILGKLEPKQRLTFELVRLRGESGVRDLMNDPNADDVGRTAWNNRLASLSKSGLLIEARHGRKKSYRPLLFEGA